MPWEGADHFTLIRLSLELPGFVIAAGHIDYPWTSETYFAATKHVNVDVDTTIWTVTRCSAQLAD